MGMGVRIRRGRLFYSVLAEGWNADGDEELLLSTLSISLQYPALLSLQTEESSLLQQWGFQMALSVMSLGTSTQAVAMVSKSGIQLVHL
jgi:hypothetical protein